MKFFIAVVVSSAFAVAACRPTPVASPGYHGMTHDIGSKGGKVYSQGKGLVVIGAGVVRVGKNSYWHSWYLVDQNTRVCWFKVGADFAEFDCCKLLRFKSTKPHVDWLTQEQCHAR